MATLAPRTTRVRPSNTHFSTYSLGTRCEFELADPQVYGRAVETFLAGLDELDRVASRFREDSEISRLNRSAGSPFSATENLFELVKLSLDGATLSGGLFDPSIGRALIDCGYDRDFAHLQKVRGPIESLLDLGYQNGLTKLDYSTNSWADITLDTYTRTISVPPNTSLDLGALAKAWGADRIARQIYEHTGSPNVVSLGGDVSIGGDNPLGWPVKIVEDPDSSSPDGPTLNIFDGGLATSGTTIRCWIKDSKVFHHIIDPRTQLPALSPWRTVSVIGSSCSIANVASTSAILLGESAVGWLESFRLPARLVDVDGNEHTTSSWPGTL